MPKGQPLLLDRPIQNERLRRYFEARGIRDAIVAPLQGPAGSIGTFMVADRLGDVGRFDQEDLKLVETLASSITGSLENARLPGLELSVAQLREANQMKDDFVGMVSHELRSPLTSIKGYVATLLRADVSWSRRTSVRSSSGSRRRAIACAI